MYAPSVIAAKEAVANRWFTARYGTPLVRHTIEQVAYASDQIDKLAIDGILPARLPTAITRHIANERTMCRIDFGYFSTHYCWIKSFDNRLIRFVPNVAQQIFLSLLADMEEQGRELMFQFLKARRLGVSTISQLCIQHRLQFFTNLQAIAGSDNPEDSDKLTKMLFFSFERQPKWLRPMSGYFGDPVTPPTGRYKTGLFYEFDNGNRLDLEHGSQVSDIGRGENPTVGHLSELAKMINAVSLIDAGLMRAIIPSPAVFWVFEGTADGDDNWWARKYRYNKANYGSESGTSRMRPTFLPWFVGTDIYPTEMGKREYERVKGRWQPKESTLKHAASAREYVAANPLLRKHLGDNWAMPPEQQHFYEFSIKEYKENGILYKWLQEMACVTGDTRISTSNGIMRIDSQELSHSVCKTETGLLTKWRDVGERNVLRLITRAGRQIVATLDHKISTPDGWVETQALKTGQLINLSAPIFALNPHTVTWEWTPKVKVFTTVDEDWGRFLGYFMGDGCFSSKDCVAIACDKKDPDVIEDCAETIRRITGKMPTREDRPGMVLLRSNSIKWTDILLALGAIEPRFAPSLGRTDGWKRKVCVPNAILRSPKPIIRQFLSALFECDGHAYKDAAQVKLFSKDPEFMRDVQLLLLGFGVNSRHIATLKKKPDREYTGRELRIGAVAANAFYDKVGFVSQRKQSGKRRDGTRTWGVFENDLLDRVESVESAGVEKVYDVTIAETHCFGGNGILVHNSDDESAFQSRAFSIYDAELRMDIRNSLTNPQVVYAIRGKDIPAKFHPSNRDTSGTPPIPIRAAFAHNLPPFDFELVPLKFTGYSETDPANKLFIWEPPRDGETYYLSIDTADGLGADRSDNTVCQVLRKGDRYRNDAQVAEYASPDISGTDFWPWVLAIGRYYTVSVRGRLAQPQVVVETNREGGRELIKHLQSRGWANFYYHLRGKTPHIGIHVTRANRTGDDSIIQNFNQAFNNGYLKINSYWLIGEADSFVKHPNGKIAAADGRHDDRLFALAEGHYAMYSQELRSSQPAPFIDRAREIPAAERYPLLINSATDSNVPYSKVEAVTEDWY